MNEERWLPLFPLKMVLFPGMLLPLRVFEQRYRLLVNRCLSQHVPFGVVLIRQGEEVGATAMPYDVGTTAYIMRHELRDDGQVSLVTVGRRRFRILKIREEAAYLEGLIRFFPDWAEMEPVSPTLVQQLNDLLERYAVVLAEAEHTALRLLARPQSPPVLAYYLAAALQVPNEEKQELLTIADLGDMLSKEREYLRREIALLSHWHEPQPKRGDGIGFVTPPSLN